MSLRFDFAIRGDLDKLMRLERRAVQGALTTVVRRVTANLKNAIRRQMIAGGLGERLGNTVRGVSYPRTGDAHDPRGVVYSKAIYGRTGGQIDLLTVFDEGAHITAEGDGWLTIPTAAAGKITGSRGAPRPRQPGDFPAGSLVFQRNHGGWGETGRLFHRGNPRETLFVAVREVTIRKVLTLASLHERVTGSIDLQAAREMEKRSQAIPDSAWAS
jgi:hypothetical protein